MPRPRLRFPAAPPWTSGRGAANAPRGEDADGDRDLRWSYNVERSYAVAVWLFVVAASVIALVVVGGATRLTGSGLSITEWRPVTGVLPPLDAAGWAAEFAKYQRIPQYVQVNRGMSLADFQSLYWWEWAHRLLARGVGVVFAVPFLAFLLLRRLPTRLIWRCVVILALGGLQGLVGWWMVASGLAGRVSVAPERLAVHLGLALALYAACLWTGLEAWFGRGRIVYGPERRWGWGAPALATLAYAQCLLGALVSGSRAGLIDGDWPLMAGRIFPEGYIATGQGLLGSLLHSLPAVQFNHRIGAYTLLAASYGFAAITQGNRFMAPPVRGLAWLFAGAVTLQATLGVLTLWAGDPLSLAITHQLGAVAVLSTALVLAWRTRRN